MQYLLIYENRQLFHCEHQVKLNSGRLQIEHGQVDAISNRNDANIAGAKQYLLFGAFAKDLNCSRAPISHHHKTRIKIASKAHRVIWRDVDRPRFSINQIALADIRNRRFDFMSHRNSPVINRAAIRRTGSLQMR
jgi:hypothetical protein